MRRSLYLVVFVILSGAAGVFYYAHTQVSMAIVATRDLTVGTRIEDADVRMRPVNPSSINDSILTSANQAIGQIVAFPLLEGEFIDARHINPTRNAAMLGSGLQVPAGYRIIGLPIAPATAVGGVLKPGDRVDVLAIPTSPKTVALAEQPPAAATVIARDVLVLGLRTDQGTAIDETGHGLNLNNGKPASVLVAIPASEEQTYSAAIADSTFVLALSTD